MNNRLDDVSLIIIIIASLVDFAKFVVFVVRSYDEYMRKRNKKKK